MLYRKIYYTYVLVILPKNMLAEIPRSQPSFTMIKTEMFVRLVLKQFVRALKLMHPVRTGSEILSRPRVRVREGKLMSLCY
jgi:hypothetical protein